MRNFDTIALLHSTDVLPRWLLKAVRPIACCSALCVDGGRRMMGNEDEAAAIMRDQAKLGVVTVTYNSMPVLDDFLRSVSGQTLREFTLYVVDSGSNDGSLRRLRAWGDERLRVMENGRNVGIAEGNNQGLRAALADGCESVLFLNNDVVFAEETFATLLAERERLQCDLLAPKILCGDGVHIWSAGGGFNATKGYHGYHYGENERDSGQYDVERVVEHAPACCLLVGRRVFDVIGVMDTRYFVYHDDTDFNYRAWRAGLTMMYSPRATIVHKVSSLTGGSTSAFTIRYNARGHVYFMLKHLGLLWCLYYLPAWELRLIYKLATGKIEWREFAIRQRALFEGIGVWWGGLFDGQRARREAEGMPS